MLVGWMMVVLGATDAQACSPMQPAVLGMMPADGAADVPAGSRVRAVWNAGANLGAATYAWTGPDGAAVPFTLAVAPGGTEGPSFEADYAELEAASALAEGEHEIVVTLGDEVMATSAFTVAADLDVSTPDAPSGADLVVDDHVGEPVDECDMVDARYASLTITPDAGPNSVVHVLRPSGDVVASFAVHGDDFGPVTWVMDIVPGSEECLTLVQENALGDLSEPSAPICATVGAAADPEEESGCQTAPGSFGAGLLVLIAALATRRKRAL